MNVTIGGDSDNVGVTMNVTSGEDFIMLNVISGGSGCDRRLR